MLLLQTEKDRCLDEIATELPELLVTAKISVSDDSRLQLLQIIKNDVTLYYFSSCDALEELYTKLGSRNRKYAFDIQHTVPACPNTELTSISPEKLNLLDLLIFVKILSKYRDIARETETNMALNMAVYEGMPSYIRSHNQPKSIVLVEENTTRKAAQELENAKQQIEAFNRATRTVALCP